jgi:hypothetical protein
LKSTITISLIGDMPLEFANYCKYARFYTWRLFGPSTILRIAVRCSVWTPLPLPPLSLTWPDWNRADSVSFLAPFSILGGRLQQKRCKPTGGGVTSEPAAA